MRQKIAKKLTSRHKEWLWFFALWCGGIFTLGAVARIIKWVIAHMNG